MGPDVSAFTIGLLFGAAKIGGVAAIGFAIAWWRAHRRIRELEMSVAGPTIESERLDRLEQGYEYIAAQLDHLLEEQRSQTRLLSSGNDLRAREEPNGMAGGSDTVA